MNKLVKGAVAGAAGIALLMGGAGTLAYWNSSANIADTTITSGTLLLSASNGTWSGSPTRIVPGATITYTSNVSITAEGTNLYSTFALDQSTITGDAALLANTTKVVSLGTVTGGTLTAHATIANTYNVVQTTPGTPITVPVTVTVTFPTTVAGTTAQTQSMDLSNLGFTLVQRPTAAF